MALVLCPECGEETLDQLVNCPLCDEPLSERQEAEKPKNGRLFFYGLLFIGGLGAATVCNMFGYTALAMGLGMVAVISMVVLTLNLFATR
jgi:hypothetical protein